MTSARHLERRILLPAADMLRDAGVDEQWLRQLCKHGAVDLAALLRIYCHDEVDLSSEASLFAIDGPRRRIILDEMRSGLNRSVFRPRALLRFLKMAEMCGSIADLQAGVRRGLADLSPISRGISRTKALPEWLDVARIFHDIECIEGMPDSAAFASELAAARHDARAYRRFCAEHGLDAHAPLQYLAAFAQGRTLRLDRPTVVLRYDGSMFSSLRLGVERIPPLFLLQEVRALGLDVAIYPQFSKPGPAFVAPFDLADPNLVCMVSLHKYSYIQHPKLLHYRHFFGPYLILDHGGYSAWMSTPSWQTVRRRVAQAPVAAFCERERVNKFNAEWPKGVPRNKPFLFVALQLENDSVRDLAFSDPVSMVAMCYNYFYPRGWNIVIKRHPKDKYIITESLIQRARQLAGIYVSDAPANGLVQHASAVALVNSTVGWDAVLAGKPILSFGLSEYGHLTSPVRSEADFQYVDLSPMPERRVEWDELYYYYFNYWMLQTHQSVVERFRETIQALMQGSKPPYMSE